MTKFVTILTNRHNNPFIAFSEDVLNEDIKAWLSEPVNLINAGIFDPVDLLEGFNITFLGEDEIFITTDDSGEIITINRIQII